MGAKILIICVNYHNERETVAFAQSLIAQDTDIDHQLLIVDNSEDTKLPKALLELASRYNNVAILCAENNLGYYGAARWGLKQFLDKNTLPEWVIVCNTDLYIEDKDFLAKLINDKEICNSPIIAPAIINYNDGSDQNPFMSNRPSILRMHFYKVIFKYFLTAMLYHLLSAVKNKLKKPYRPKGINNDNIAGREIYAPHGAFIIFGEEYFLASGSLDYGSFLYDEEIFVAETARNLNLKIVYVPKLRVIHKEHATTTKLMHGQMYRYKYQSSMYCANKYFPLKLPFTKRGDKNS